jgi:hypothetical protein
MSTCDSLRTDWLFVDDLRRPDYIASVIGEWLWTTVEWYWQGKTVVLREENVSHSDIVHDKPHMDWLRTKHGLAERIFI